MTSERHTKLACERGCNGYFFLFSSWLSLVLTELPVSCTIFALLVCHSATHFFSFLFSRWLADTGFWHNCLQVAQCSRWTQSFLFPMVLSDYARIWIVQTSGHIPSISVSVSAWHLRLWEVFKQHQALHTQTTWKGLWALWIRDHKWLPFSSIVLCSCENQGMETVNGIPFLHSFAPNNKQICSRNKFLANCNHLWCDLIHELTLIPCFTSCFARSEVQRIRFNSWIMSYFSGFIQSGSKWLPKQASG